jgi:hypothetical protein
MPRSPFRTRARAPIGLGTLIQIGLALLLPPGLFLPGLWSSPAVAGSSLPGEPGLRSLLDVTYAWATLLVALVPYRAIDRMTRMSVSLGVALSSFATAGRRTGP